MNLENIEKLFECNDIKLSEQKINKSFEVSIILKLENKNYGTQMIIYDNKNQRKYYSNSLLKSYLSKCLDSLQHIDNFYFKDNELNPILKFKISGFKESNGKKQVLLDFIKNKCTNEILPLSDDDSVGYDDSEEEIPQNKLKEIKTVASSMDCLKKFKK